MYIQILFSNNSEPNITDSKYYALQKKNNNNNN